MNLLTLTFLDNKENHKCFRKRTYAKATLPRRFNLRTGPSRIRSDSDENRKDPIGIYRTPGNESTNGILVSESLQDPTVGKTKETNYRNLSDPTKQTL